MDKPRCQAYLLTEQARNWRKFTQEGIRCRFSAKDGSNFCGNHVKLNAFIDQIIWKDVDGS